MNNKKDFFAYLNKGASLVLTGLIVFTLFNPVNAEEEFSQAKNTELPGYIYESGEDSEYEFTDFVSNTNTIRSDKFGTLEINGAYDTQFGIKYKDNYPIIIANEGNLELDYKFDRDLLTELEDKEHLINDKGNKIDGVKYDNDIGMGTIVIQTSRDGEMWFTDTVINDAFKDNNYILDNFYQTNNVQLLNRTYYRIIVAYKTTQKVGTRKILFLNKNVYETKKYVEVYPFVAFDGNRDKFDYQDKYLLSSDDTLVRTEQIKGYSGAQKIDRKDNHYGWKLGEFYIGGFASKDVNQDGILVFTKNVGSRIKMWFELEQDINKIKNDPKLTITNDSEGTDEYFQTSMMDFGRGTLIIKHTNPKNNISTEPQIYINFLEANANPSGMTNVGLFEEGKYEVALDYEVTKDKLVDKVSHYRVFFEFIITNGYADVHLRDLNGKFLYDGDLVKDGFTINLANSNYLEISMERQVLNTNNHLETKFSGPAEEDKEYGGIGKGGKYIIKVKNVNTDSTIQKVVYVGDEGYEILDWENNRN